MAGLTRCDSIALDCSHCYSDNADDARKGKEYKTAVLSADGTLMAVTHSCYSSVDRGGYFTVSLEWQSSATFDGDATNPKETNTTYTYDPYGNPASITSLGDVTAAGDERFETYSYAYNASAWIVGAVSNYSLYAADNTTLVRSTLYAYDGGVVGQTPTQGGLTRVERWLDTELANPATSYTYDSHGNVLTETDAFGRVTRYYYGIRDDTFTFADRAVNALDHAADAEYDPGTGNLLWSEKNDLRTEFEYDVHGRVSKEILPYDTTQSPTKSYTYTLDGTAPESVVVRQRTTANNTPDTHYFYDGFGQLVQVRSPADNGNQVVADVLYDSSGRVSETSNPYFSSFNASLTNPSTTANSTTFTYDALDRPIRVVNPDGTTLNTTFSRWNVSSYDANGHRRGYALDAYGRITQVLEYNNDPVLYFDYESDIYATNYSYDTADQLVNITDFEGNVFAFEYDSLGRRIGLDDPDMGAWSYTYDLAGNLVSQSGGGGNLVTGDSYYREYNSLNQLIRIRSGNLSTGTILEEYTYDAYGDRVKVYKNQSNETIFTPFRELMRIVNSSGTYDYLYVYEGSMLVSRLNPDGSKWFYHPDHLGSTTLITNESGHVIEETFYEPYGAITGGGTEDKKLYTGHVSDSVDQYYFGTRYYSPGLGHFTQPDKIYPDVYNPQELNKYAYALNNPYRYTDPSGRVALPIATGSIGGIIGGLIGAGRSIYTQWKAGGSIQSVNWRKVGGDMLTGISVGFVSGATFGLATPAIVGAGAAAGGGAAGVANTAAVSALATGTAGVAGQQAGIGTSNVLSGQPVTQGMGDIQDMYPTFMANAAIGGTLSLAGQLVSGSLTTKSSFPEPTTGIKLQKGSATITYKGLFPEKVGGDIHETILPSYDRYGNLYKVNIHGTIQRGGNLENLQTYSTTIPIDESYGAFLTGPKP